MEEKYGGEFMDRKRKTYENPDSIKFMSRSDVTYALMKVALQVDNIVERIRYKAIPTDKVRWERTEWAIGQLNQIIEDIKSSVQEMLQYKGKAIIAPYEIRHDGKERFLQSGRSFAILPKVQDSFKLYELIITMDNILYAYRMTLTTSLDPYKEASEEAVNVLHKLEEYTKEIAEIAGMEYETHQSVVRVLGLGEKGRPGMSRGAKKRKPKEERGTEAETVNENVSAAAMS
jgi:hypothetical protein